MAFSQPQWCQDIISSYTEDPLAQQLISELHITPNNKIYSLIDGILRFKSRLYVGSHLNIRQSIIHFVHASVVGGHSGMMGIYNRAKAYFYWPHMKDDIFKFVDSCDIFQCNKTDHSSPGGLLQPLPIPDRAWQHISMDFVEAKEFMHHIFKLHGLPSSILSDRDKVTTSVAAVQDYLQARDHMLQLLNEDLLHAKHRMKHFADLKRTDRYFVVGDLVFLKLQPYRQSSVSLRTHMKLATKYFGPFELVQRIGDVAYKLKLHISHVPQLKKKIGQHLVPYPALPLVDSAGTFIVTPIVVLDSRYLIRDATTVPQVFIQ
ncbi:uncharacterized protein LOC113290871 [Papaver somniferum]|uniref:uncharacterized protein LOC113290871 n=1 Tax=Papaver somniferum TaxID=3469 RepID=UPI000E6F7300|nr:uncharacterized protein LOC113290871 [Papaver somniferum]